MQVRARTLSLGRLTALLSVFAWASLAVAQGLEIDRYQGKEVAAHEVLVKLKPGKKGVLGKAFRAAYDIDVAEPVGRGAFMRLHSTSGSVPDLIRLLRARKDVEYVQPNHVYRALETTPNDTYFGNLWGMKNTGISLPGNSTATAGDDIKATLAWDFGTGSTLSTVCVIDTGVDYNHPDLAANMWTSPATYTVTIRGTTITIPAGSHGYNAITHTADPMDDHNHGTHCAGTIGAVGNNGLGVAGVNWTASIMACKFLASNGSGTEADAVDCIEFIRQTKAALGAAANVRVLSNSWGGGDNDLALHDAINEANDDGMLFVAAAGNANNNNDASPNYPSNYDCANVLAVAASNANDAKASFSSYGLTTVDLAAPGVGILSTIRNNGYAYFNGTSMATPHVAGAATFLLSLNPSLTVQQMKDTLMGTVDQLSQWSTLVASGGRLNLFRAAASLGDFTASSDASTVQVVQGSTGSFNLSTTALYGFRGNLDFSASGAPAGVTLTLDSTEATGTPNAASVAVAADVAPGVYPITFTVQSSSGATAVRSHTVVVNLQVDQAPDFTLSTSTPTVTVNRGITAKFKLGTGSLAGFSDPVDLAVSGLPTGCTASFQSTPVNPGSPATLLVTTSGTTPAGSFALSITGSSGSLSHTLGLTLVVNGATDFGLTASPPSQQIVLGNSGAATLTLVPKLGFTGAASLAVTGGTADVVGTLGATTIDAGAPTSLSVSVSPSAAVGTYRFVVTGTASGKSRSVSVSIVVVLPPDFSIRTTTASQTVVKGNTASYTLSAMPVRGFSETLNLSVSGLPTGATATFTPNTLPGTGATQMDVATTLDTPPGVYPLTVTFAGTSVTHTRNVTLVVKDVPNFAVSLLPTSLTLPTTGIAKSRVMVTKLNGFMSPVTLSVSGGGSGVTASVTLIGTVTYVVVTTNGAASGTYTFTVQGDGGGLTRTTTLTVTVP